MHEAPDPNTNIEEVSITLNTPQDLYLKQKDLIIVYLGTRNSWVYFQEAIESFGLVAEFALSSS